MSRRSLYVDWTARFHATASDIPTANPAALMRLSIFAARSFYRGGVMIMS
jgi:hypothetical protein